jgi:hypothetical protein
MFPSHHPQVFFSKSAESPQNKGVEISESPKRCKRVANLESAEDSCPEGPSEAKDLSSNPKGDFYP